MGTPRQITVALLGMTLVLLGVQSQGPRQGRQGNAHYEAREYLEAEEAYHDGLAGYDATPSEDAIFAALQNNLGAALHRQESYDEAQAAFEQAIQSAPGAEEEARAAYNAGNNAYRMDETGAALEYYRRALLADPDHEEARHNYEFVMRQHEQEGGASGDNDDDSAEPEDEEGPQDEQPGEDEGPPSPEDAEGGDDAPTSPDAQRPEEGAAEEMTPEQALRILEALEHDELELLQEAMRMEASPRKVEKDW